MAGRAAMGGIDQHLKSMHETHGKMLQARAPAMKQVMVAQMQQHEQMAATHAAR